MAWNFIRLQGLKPHSLLDFMSGLKPRPTNHYFIGRWPQIPQTQNECDPHKLDLVEHQLDIFVGRGFSRDILASHKKGL